MRTRNQKTFDPPPIDGAEKLLTTTPYQRGQKLMSPPLLLPIASLNEHSLTRNYRKQPEIAENSCLYTCYIFGMIINEPLAGLS